VYYFLDEPSFLTILLDDLLRRSSSINFLEEDGHTVGLHSISVHTIRHQSNACLEKNSGMARRLGEVTPWLLFPR
jgi:hypothetical protein